MRTSVVVPSVSAIVVLLLALLFLNDEVALLQNSTLESATISGCTYKNINRGRRGHVSRRSVYASIAITESGKKVKGPYIHQSRSICEKRLYRDTGVFVSEKNEQLSRINSFYDFWLVPFVFTVLFLGLVLSALKASAIGIPIGYSTPIIAAVVPVFLLAMYWKGYETTPNSAALGTGSKTLTETNFSNELLERCIKQTIRDGDYAHEQEIQQLICQDMKISDLSRLEGFTGLERLYLQSNKLDNLETLPKLTNLKLLSVAANDLTSLSGISNAPNLEELQSVSNNVTRIDELSKLDKLQTVGFMSNGVSNLSPLTTLKNLKSVDFSYNEISDISALESIPTLASVGLYYNDITDISPLFESRGLEELRIVDKGNTIRCEQVEYLLSQFSFKIHDSWRSLCH